jgi:hypothetical protein
MTTARFRQAGQTMRAHPSIYLSPLLPNSEEKTSAFKKSKLPLSIFQMSGLGVKFLLKKKEKENERGTGPPG